MFITRIKPIFQLNKLLSVTAKRKFGNEVDERLWNISSYRYMAPIQTRFGDNDMYSHVNQAMYFNYFAVVTRAMTALQDDGFDEKYVQVTAKMECIYRKEMCFPDTLLAGGVYSHLGKSSSRIHVALFNPKKQGDPCKEMGLGLNGSHVNTLDMEKVTEMYESEASILSTATLVLLDINTKKPVLKMPSLMLEHYKKLHL